MIYAHMKHECLFFSKIRKNEQEGDEKKERKFIHFSTTIINQSEGVLILVELLLRHAHSREGILQQAQLFLLAVERFTEIV